MTSPTPEQKASAHSKRPLRLLVILPSWVGDAVMATPALRTLRVALPGTFIGGLVRPGLDDILAGSDLLDELHVDRASGVMGPKRVAAKLRARRYDTALLLTNSFSTALIARLAFIPRRIGYDRDGRGLLLTERLRPERRGSILGLPLRWACVPALLYYLTAARAAVGNDPPPPILDPRLELAVTDAQQAAALEVLARARVEHGAPYAILNPGGNNPAKRWPAARFAEVGAALARERNWTILVSGSPGEAALVEEVAAAIGPAARPLTSAGVTLGSLKGITRGAKFMLTNDTGPRHIALAFNVPTVSLFGPTDPRWTTPPAANGASERRLVADPTLPETEIADDHPDRCRIDRIETASVLTAAHALLGPA